METVIGIEGSEEGNIHDNEADKSTSDLGSLKHAANPVIYKLVRVDIDGRLVPATDDELMEVDEFFDYESSEMLSVADDVQTAGCSFSEDDLPDKPLSGGDEGFLQFENSKIGEEQLNAKIEYDDGMLQRITEEERHQSASGSSVHPSAGVSIEKAGIDQCDNLSIVDNLAPTEISGQKMLSKSASILNEIGTNQSGDPEDCSNTQEEIMEKGTSASSVSTSLKPDFSLLEGEVDLDKLTIREIQEVFRATFGRETTVKDKQWLKRRIAMGLANSCDVPLTSFIIKDNKLVKKVEDDHEQADDISVGKIGVLSDDMKDVQVDCDNKTEVASSTRLRNLLNEDGSTDNSPLDQKTPKRVRKPTKRYIEELSDMETQETFGRPVSSAKHSGDSRDLPKKAVAPAWEVRSSAVVMRPDLLGGSGVQVPCVSRIRRCRPRKSIVTLDPSRLETELVSNATGIGVTQLDNVSYHNVAEARAIPFGELPIDEKSKEQWSQISVEPTSVGSSGNSPDCDFTTKGGMRRKHHRAWSLSEVVKLVDGVSRYGAGRWSEIKRISFASYSYRTTVDLKDKWRNLLKASFAAMSSEKAMNQQRKPTSTPIPAPILLKVRELAEMNGQKPRNFKPSSGNGGTSVNEK